MSEDVTGSNPVFLVRANIIMQQRQAIMTMLITFVDALQEGRARASEHWRRDGEIQLVVHKAAEDAKERGKEARGTQHRSAKLTVVMDQLLA